MAVLAPGKSVNLVPTIQPGVGALNPDLPVYRVRTMTKVMGDSLQRRRLAFILPGVFACGFVARRIGIHGGVFLGIAPRHREIALGMALSPDRGRVMRIMFRRGKGTITIGLALPISGSDRKSLTCLASKLVRLDLSNKSHQTILRYNGS